MASIERPSGICRYYISTDSSRRLGGVPRNRSLCSREKALSRHSVAPIGDHYVARQVCVCQEPPQSDNANRTVQLSALVRRSHISREPDLAAGTEAAAVRDGTSFKRRLGIPREATVDPGSCKQVGVMNGLFDLLLRRVVVPVPRKQSIHGILMYAGHDNI